MVFTLPSPHTKPGGALLHTPVHATTLEFPPASVPNVRNVHGVHTPAPAPLYWPAGHMEPVALTLPGGQKYPAGQAPEHTEVVRPATAPNTPAGHSVPLGLVAPGLQ